MVMVMERVGGIKTRIVDSGRASKRGGDLARKNLRSFPKQARWRGWGQAENEAFEAPLLAVGWIVLAPASPPSSSPSAHTSI